MLLLVDAGNSRIKWAVAETAGGPAALGVWKTSGSAMLALAEQCEEAWRTLNITEVLVSNVAGQAARRQLENIFNQLLNPEVPVRWVVSAPELAGLHNGYRQPEQLGSDRFVSAIGGRAMFPDRRLMIVTLGTATTIDAVSADGTFVGGMILPGLNLMAGSLAQNTAQLPEVLQQDSYAAPFADNTEDAIVSGCVNAQTGAIERAYVACARLDDSGDMLCIVSGGAVSSIVPHVAVPCTYVDNLVLIGLQTIALYSKPPQC